MTKEVKYRDIESFLRGLGWKVVRQSGSHIVWAAPEGPGRLSIPPHKGKVSPGVVRQIIKKLPEAPNEWR
jgi:predicted RNA binding protein YcfA (HicA-like mRNA interferase family)